MVFSLVSAVQEKVGEMLDSEVTAAAAEQKAEEIKQKEKVGIADVEIQCYNIITPTFINPCFLSTKYPSK